LGVPGAASPTKDLHTQDMATICYEAALSAGTKVASECALRGNESWLGQDTAAATPVDAAVAMQAPQPT
jgi:hypothetical protein